jgi:hypothetical protein
VSQREERDDDTRTNGQVRRHDDRRGERTRGRNAPTLRADRTESRHRTLIGLLEPDARKRARPGSEGARRSNASGLPVRGEQWAAGPSRPPETAGLVSSEGLGTPIHAPSAAWPARNACRAARCSLKRKATGRFRLGLDPVRAGVSPPTPVSARTLYRPQAIDGAPNLSRRVAVRE